MAHKVTFNVPNRLLGKEDILFEIFDEDEGIKLGTLRVSKGGVDWRPRHGKVIYRARWGRFDDVMRRHITPTHP